MAFGAMIPVAIRDRRACRYSSPFAASRGNLDSIAFIGRFLVSSAVLVAVPVLWGVEGGVGLIAATVVALAALVGAYRRARLLSAEELDAVASIPVPLAGRLARLLGAAR
jgi:hypothetical protein